MSFGQSMKKYREMRGMTQAQLAQVLGYKNKASIGKIENGDADVPLSKALDIADALGVDIMVMIHGIDQTSVRYMLRKRMDECGIDWKKENLTFHSFRHFFNTRLLAAGIQGETIRAVIGHEDEKMTQLYGHLSASDCDRIRVIQEAI